MKNLNHQVLSFVSALTESESHRKRAFICGFIAIVVAAVFFPLATPPSKSAASIVTNGIIMEAKKPVGLEGNSSISVTIVSMNVVECKPSQEAPSSWSADTVAQAFGAELVQHNPDILALQECPGTPSWAETTFGKDFGDGHDSYVLLGSAKAPLGYVMLLVRHSLAHQATRISLSDTLPVVMAQIDFGYGRHLLVASCHLAPFERGREERREQMQALLTVQQQQQSLWLMIAGDTNMRPNEDRVMEQKLHYLDGWKEAGSPLQAKFTWDTRDHRRGPRRSFNRYYGSRTHEYTGRYDRLYLKNLNNMSRLNITSFQVIADQPVPPSSTHFLSDHFGLVATVDFQW